MRLKGGASLAVALALCAVASMGRTQEAPAPIEPIEAPANATPTIGSGAYRYQVTLRDHLGEAKPRMPFALSLKKGVLPFVAEEKNVWRGVTDDQGRTPVFALPDRIAAQDVFLRLRLGDGPLGEQMRLVSTVDDQPLSVPYRLVICTNPPQQFFGISDGDGFTAYAASAAPAHILLYATEEDPDYFIGRDGDLFWNDQTEPGVDPVTHKTARAKAKQLRANRKACKKAAT